MRSIKRRRAVGVGDMGENFVEDALVGAVLREGRQVGRVEEIHSRGFHAGGWFSIQNFAQEDNLVGVPELKWGEVVGIIDSDHFFSPDRHAAFFKHFALDHLLRRFAQIGPAAGQRPAAIGDFLHEQNLSIADNRCAHIDFGRWITSLDAETFEDGFLLQRGLGGNDLADLLQTLITLEVEIVFAVGQPGLRKGIDFAGKGQPLGDGGLPAIFAVKIPF